MVVERLLPDIQQILLPGLAFLRNVLPDLLPDPFAAGFLMDFLQHLLPDVLPAFCLPKSSLSAGCLPDSWVSA